ncbi:MAG TPA: hypothetical protein VFJ82_00530 [Longimicrobium sp.]|nr:hypothetical protein [Longimicrobium sp.]
MRRIVAAVLLVLPACKPQQPGGGPAPRPLRLCVQNETVAYGNVIAYAGPVRFDVMPGREVCKRLAEPGPFVQLRANTTSGGAHGPLSYAARLQVGATRCWAWRLTEAPGGAGDLSPCAGEAAADSAAGG